MKKNKNQHYIPRLLLSRFLAQTRAGDRVFRFLRGGATVEARGLSQAGSAFYFYRDGINVNQPDALDEVLLDTESRIGPVITDICDAHLIPQPGSGDHRRMVRFIHDLYLRTPSVRAQLNAWGAEKMREDLGDPFYTQNKAEIDATIARWMNGTPDERYRAEIHLQSTGQIATLSEGSQRILHRWAAEKSHQRVLDLLDRRHWRILVAPARGPCFVLGDEPVVIHDQFGNVRIGLKHPKSRVSLPLSPNVVLQGCYSHVEQRVVAPSHFSVKRLNGVFVRTAFREVFASQPDFEWQHQAGRTFNAADWMAGIAEATWPSNPTLD